MRNRPTSPERMHGKQGFTQRKGAGPNNRVALRLMQFQSVTKHGSSFSLSKGFAASDRRVAENPSSIPVARS